MKKFTKIVMLVLCIAMIACCAFVGCDNNNNNNNSDITVAFTRPTTSGTYGAFNELVKNSEGKTLKDALKEGDFARNVQESKENGTVIQDVSANDHSIGYVSLGLVAANSNLIKSVKVEGVEATVDNILKGTYKLARPFNFIYPKDKQLNDLAQNFIDFINSKEGQALVNVDYIGQSDSPEKSYIPYAGSETTLTLTGSTSVQPLLRDSIIPAFQKANPGKKITIECSGSGSGQGETDADSGANDLGMISRDGDESKYNIVTIALDGIAIIVQKDVKLSNVTMDQLYNLYMNGTAIELD